MFEKIVAKLKEWLGLAAEVADTVEDIAEDVAETADSIGDVLEQYVDEGDADGRN